jgi:HAD superfamily hydrolase (TIGR01509 family)
MLKIQNIKAVVFDMDGLLLDSERVILEDFIASCREFGFEPDVNVYYKCIGGNQARTKEIMLAGYGKEFPYDAVNASWFSKAGKKPIPLKKGVASMLEFLKKRSIRQVVVTSTHRFWATKSLAEAGILPCFEFIMCGDDISKSKPDPEIYIQACKKLDLRPEDCLALEDSDNGVLAAYNAGMQVIQIPDIVPPSDRVRALGHRIMDSLEEVERLFYGDTAPGRRP